MDFNKVIETKDGGVQVEASFNAEEVAFLIELAVTTLLRDGAITYVNQTTEAVVPAGSALN